MKTALVLAGGGLSGAVYEIGALRAIDDLLVDLDTSQFDIYVGTSAGALVASFLANGITPAELMRALDNDHPFLRGPRARDIFGPNLREWAVRAINIPRTAAGIARYYAGHWRDMPLTDAVYAMADALPSAFYSNHTLADYVHRTLLAAGSADDFRRLERQLYIIGTDLDTGQRAVFGEGDLRDVPISRAVAASAAVPILYRPVRIKGIDYIDGGMRGTASLDVAIEHGAQVVVVVNSAVPLDNTQPSGADAFNSGRRLADKGMAAVAAQVYRTWFHSGLVYQIKQIQRRHPDVTVILIEPPATDTSMFFFNPMRYSSRMTIAQHGYESVTVNLARDYHKFRDMLSRYGITISPKRVNRELQIMRQGHNSPDAIRSVMENLPIEALASLDDAADDQDTDDKPMDLSSISARLDRALRALDRTLARQQRNGGGPAED